MWSLLPLIVLLLLPSLVLSAVPQWIGPDDGSGAIAKIQTCLNAANIPTLQNPTLGTFWTSGFGGSGSNNPACYTSPVDNSCLKWEQTGTTMCEKVFGKSCLRVMDENCIQGDCSQALYSVSGLTFIAKAAYCNVECPAGTYNLPADQVMMLKLTKVKV